ncbi:MAG TPA: amino acid permease [Vicinamibacterales bacterium]|nr:amino acid permease [Vicinamibacterales bacterium]
MPQASTALQTHVAPRRLLGTWAATAMVITEVVGVGIFLTPATMMRTLGSLGAALMIWAAMGALSAAGALCYAELSTRFPRAGGGYVFLREAYGPRCAFLYGWMALLVVDPGLAAALGIGLSRYLLATFDGSPLLLTPVSLACVVGFGLLTLQGVRVSARVMRWTAAAKLAIVATLVVAGLRRGLAGSGRVLVESGVPAAAIGPGALATSVVAAFFAFGGWWELGRMSEEVESPRRTMPRALIGGVAIVAGIYALVSVAFVLATPGPAAATDEAFVSLVGAALFGEAAGRLLAAMVAMAVGGSLAAVLLGAPRVYLAMARDGLFPGRLARFDVSRGAAPGGTLVQVSLASLLIVLGSFDDILAYFVPSAVFFLGLSAAAVIVLPRPGEAEAVFRAPAHPLPILLFLVLIVSILALFVFGQPRQTLLGAAVVLLGIPVAWIVVPRRPQRS